MSRKTLLSFSAIAIFVSAGVASTFDGVEAAEYHFRVGPHVLSAAEGGGQVDVDPDGAEETAPEAPEDDSPIVASEVVNEFDRPVPIQGGQKYIIWDFAGGSGSYQVEVEDAPAGWDEWIFPSGDWVIIDPWSSSHVGSHEVSFRVSDGETSRVLGPYLIEVFDPAESDPEGPVAARDVGLVLMGDVAWGSDGLVVSVRSTNSSLYFEVEGGGSYTFTPGFYEGDDTNWIHVTTGASHAVLQPDARNVGKTYPIMVRVVDAYGDAFWYYGPNVTFTE